MNMKKVVLALAVTLWMVCGVLPAADNPQGEYKPFNKTDYQGPNFHVHKKQLKHGDVTISTIQVSNTDNQGTGHPNDWDCRAWLNIEKNGKVLNRYYFDTIGAVGENPYGLLVPPIQPSLKYSFVEKIGDYQTQLYLVGKDGDVTKIHGGNYFLAKKSRYLFVQNSEAEDGMTDVFDLVSGKLIFSAQIPNDVPYQKGDLYFYSTAGLAPNGNDEVENKQKILYFDFDKANFVSENVNQDFWRDAKKIEYNFPLWNYDCNCGDTGASGKPPL